MVGFKIEMLRGHDGVQTTANEQSKKDHTTEAQALLDAIKLSDKPTWIELCTEMDKVAKIFHLKGMSAVPHTIYHAHVEVLNGYPSGAKAFKAFQVTRPIEASRGPMGSPPNMGPYRYCIYAEFKSKNNTVWHLRRMNESD
jgi:hypothetical protein